MADYTLIEVPDGVAVGTVLTIPAPLGGLELESVAVDTTQQNRGIGRRMLAAVFDELRRRDFFSPARSYPAFMEDNGIRLRDRVWMDLEL